MHFTMQVGGRPVKIELTREETFTNTRTRHSIEYDMEAGVDAEGHLLAKRDDYLFQSGSLCIPRTCHSSQWSDGQQTSVCMPKYPRRSIYRLYQLSSAGGAMRGYGIPQFALPQRALWMILLMKSVWIRWNSAEKI